ncbi:hypothetical protein V8E54_000414 [Elaphomyces granulatus]
MPWNGRHIDVGGADAVDVMAGLPWEWKLMLDIIIFKVAGLCHHRVPWSGRCSHYLYNTGAEIGATTSLFPFNDRIYDYLKATKRQYIGDFSRAYADGLTEDAGAEYDQLIELRLNRWPEELKADLTGSCTNSSYEDMPRTASIARDALNHGIKASSLFTVTPGSEQIRATIERDSQIQTLEEFGGVIEKWDRRNALYIE